MAAGRAEIERRAGNVLQLAGRNEGAVHGREAAGVDFDGVVENVALPREVEVGMMGEVDDGVLVGGGGEIKAQSVVIRERVDGLDVEVAGETFLAVLAEITQFHCRAVRGQRWLGVPNHLVKARAGRRGGSWGRCSGRAGG